MRAEDAALGARIAGLEERWRAEAPELGVVTTADTGGAGSEWCAAIAI